MKNLKTYILIAVIIFLFIFGCKQTLEKRELQKQQDNTVSFLQDSVTYYKDKYGKEVATKTSLAGDKKHLQILLSKQIDSTEQLKELVKEFKDVKSAGIITTETKIDTVYIPFDKPIDNNFKRNFLTKKPYYIIKGEVNQNGITFKDITIPNKLSFVIGAKKDGWFSRKTYNIDVKSSNPNVKTIGVDSYSFIPKKDPFSIGPYIGYDPFQGNISAGISVQWAIIKF